MPSYDLDSESSLIWHLLLEHGMATEEQLEEVYDDTQRLQRPFLKLVYNYNICTEEQLLSLIAENIHSEIYSFKGKEEIPEDVLAKMPADQAHFYGAVPIAFEDDILTIVAREPLNTALTDELPFILGFQTQVLVGYPKEVDEQLAKYYPEHSVTFEGILEDLKAQHAAVTGEKEPSLDDPLALEQAANAAPIVRYVNMVLQQAIRDKASDIHFEPFGDEFRIRYRLDGALYEMAPPPKSLAIPVISRIKVMSNLNISERRVPQDGRIELRVDKKPIDIRVSTLPTRYGESVVLRILDRGVVNLSLDSLGMSDYVKGTIRRLISRPNGIFLVTGPTGSGKTTTLYSGLREINTIEDKLLTAEDPVEYDIEGIMQVPIRENVGMTFAAALRSFLRQDPDRIMVGEIRDVETASMAIQASLTGHLVLSTLHTNDACGAVTRLIDMGIEPFLISSTVCGVLAQRLIRRICTKCKEAYDPTDMELEKLGMTREQLAGRKFYRGRGCDACSNSGYKGRVGIFEMLSISTEMKKMINAREPTQVIKDQAVKEGLLTLRQDGINHVLDGVTTAREVIIYTMA